MHGVEHHYSPLVYRCREWCPKIGPALLGPFFSLVSLSLLPQLQRTNIILCQFPKQCSDCKTNPLFCTVPTINAPKRRGWLLPPLKFKSSLQNACNVPNRAMQRLSGTHILACRQDGRQEIHDRIKYCRDHPHVTFFQVDVSAAGLRLQAQTH